MQQPSPKSTGYRATLELKSIARSGLGSNGEPIIWRFKGHRTVKTIPRLNEGGRFCHWPNVEILDNDGKWLTEAEAIQTLQWDTSMLSGWHPAHICGIFCDGQDGNGSCTQERYAGPPEKSPLEQLAETAENEYMTKQPADSYEAFDDYQRFTGATAVYPKKGDGDPLALSYCALGLTEEAGEVAGKLKKRIRIGGFEALAPGTTILKSKNGSTHEESYEDFRESVKKEIGDVLWYAARLADEFDLKLSEVVGCNIEKLTRRRREGTIHGEGDNR